MFLSQLDVGGSTKERESMPTSNQQNEIDWLLIYMLEQMKMERQDDVLDHVVDQMKSLVLKTIEKMIRVRDDSKVKIWIESSNI